jgi:thiol:disulfide interchange protein
MIPLGRTAGFIAAALASVALAQSPADNAGPALTAALASAKTSRQHILLNFGAEWCLECRILDKTFAEPTVAAFLKENFIVVPIHVGQMVLLNYAEKRQRSAPRA